MKDTSCIETPLYPGIDECYQRYSIEELDLVIYTLKDSILRDSQERCDDINYQHGYCSTPQKQNYLIYLKGVQDYRNQLTRGIEPCICCDDVQSLIENAKSAVGFLCNPEERDDVRVDKSQADRWVLQNPELVPYERWERVLIDTACKVDINPEAIRRETLCAQVDVVLDIQELVCGTPGSVETRRVVCDTKVGDVTVDPIKCAKEYYEVLVAKHQCTFTEGDYLRMVECGVDLDLTIKALSCGMTVDVKPTQIDLCGNEGQVVLSLIPADF